MAQQDNYGLFVEQTLAKVESLTDPIQLIMDADPPDSPDEWEAPDVQINRVIGYLRSVQQRNQKRLTIDKKTVARGLQ